MSQNNVIELKKPEPFVDDPITEIIRQGARKLLAQALEAEIELFINRYADLRDELGRQRIVRNGYLPQREIQSGVGAVKVKAPRVRDRHTNPSEKFHFDSSILPPYLRKTKSIEELIPWLYLKGISTGDFSDALAALVGTDAPGFSAATISRLKANWQQDLDHWQKRDLSAKQYVYFWVDGIYCNVRMDDKQCLLVIIKARGLNQGPQLAIGDGGLGFWKALTFHDFPAEHWRHIRTTYPIESTFATVRLRTNKVRGRFSAQTVITMAFELCQCAQKQWIRLHHQQRLAEIIRKVKFVNVVEEKRIAA